VSLVGRSFGVFKLRPRGWDGDEIDVSVPRRDSKVGPGHRGIAVEGDPSMSIEEASRRRDLTVNALMYDLVEERVVDPQGGLDDLRDGRLRAVDADTFLEDPLRALRAVQFTARLGFQVDPGLVSLCRAASLDELPAERILGEWTKLMLHGVAVSQGLQVARDAQILSRVFPMVSDAPDPVADAALDRLAKGPRDLQEPEGRRWVVMLAAWLHGCDAASAEAALDVLGLHRWRGYDVRTATLRAISQRAAPVASDAELRWLSTRAEVGLVLTVRAALEPDFDPPTARAAALGVLTEAPPRLIQGRDLAQMGVAPGPNMGRILDAVYGQQLDGVVTDPSMAAAAAAALIRGPE